MEWRPEALRSEELDHAELAFDATRHLHGGQVIEVVVLSSTRFEEQWPLHGLLCVHGAQDARHPSENLQTRRKSSKGSTSTSSSERAAAHQEWARSAI